MTDGTGGGTGVWSFSEVTDAAATVAAVSRGAPGIYNVVDNDPAPVAQWLPYLASCLGAKPPLRAPAWLGRLLGGEMTVSMMTEVRGAGNSKAKRELGWTPPTRAGGTASRPGPRHSSPARPHDPPPDADPEAPAADYTEDRPLGPAWFVRDS